VNWFLSKEGQTLTHTLVTNIDRSSLRNDILLARSRRTNGANRASSTLSPDADPEIRRAPEEAQKWIYNIWETRQKVKLEEFKPFNRVSYASLKRRIGSKR
jgi:hypothetical protein